MNASSNEAWGHRQDLDSLVLNANFVLLTIHPLIALTINGGTTVFSLTVRRPANGNQFRSIRYAWTRQQFHSFLSAGFSMRCPCLRKHSARRAARDCSALTDPAWAAAMPTINRTIGSNLFMSNLLNSELPIRTTTKIDSIRPSNRNSSCT